jgi:hypothetical protein
MRIRVCLLMAFVVTVIPAAYAAGAGAATRARVPCGRPAAHTLAVDRVARVYTSRGLVWGCAAGRRSYRLGANGPRDRVGPIALAGTVTAYGLTRSGVDTVSASVLVRQLRTGAVLRDEQAITAGLGPEFFEAVDAVVVRSDGAVAWTARAGSVISGQAREIEVNRADRRGRSLLDSGKGIQTQSLRLRGARISWRHGAQTRSAVLA